MRLRLASLLGAVLVAVLVSAPSALAGNWAITYLDPLPDTLGAGQPYTVGYWVLQHGSHPSYGELGATALVFTPEKGDPVEFPGVALREPAHYAAAIALPHDGVWRVSARQGGFADYEIGTLTLPGRLAVTPPPAPMTNGEKQPWGAIRPPAIALNGGGGVPAQPIAPPVVAAAPETPAPLGVVLAVAGLVVAGGAALLVGGRGIRRRLRGGVRAR